MSQNQEYLVSHNMIIAAGICCRWSDDVQRSARWSTRSRSQHNNIPTIDEDTFSLPISTFRALGVFHVMRYINVQYLLTYLLTLTYISCSHYKYIVTQNA